MTHARRSLSFGGLSLFGNSQRIGVARPERQAMGVAHAWTTTTPFAGGSGTCHPMFGYLVAVVSGLAGAIGCGSAPVTAPTAFTAYNSKNGTFACEYPEGWDADGGGGRGPEWAKFLSGPAEIRVSTGVAGSLMADVASSAGGTNLEPVPPELEPVHDIHMDGVEDAEKNYGGYKETGEPQVMEVSLGPARRSEFTASTTFGSGLHGYRATILGHDKAVTVFCICPESDWKTLQPAFDHLLGSLRRGQAE